MIFLINIFLTFFSKVLGQNELQINMVYISETAVTFYEDAIRSGIRISLEKFQSNLPAHVKLSPLLLDMDPNSPECSVDAPIAELCDKHTKETLHVVLHFGCGNGIYRLGYLMSDWNITYISAAMTTYPMDKKKFKTMTVLSCGSYKNNNCIVKLIEFYSWRTIALMCNTSSPMLSLMCDTLKLSFNPSKSNTSQYNITEIPVYINQSNDFHKVLIEARNAARVYIVFVLPQFVRDLMLAAHDLYMTEGDGVFIIQMVGSASVRMLHWKKEDGADERAKQAFESALLISDQGAHNTEIDDELQVEVEKGQSKHGQTESFDSPLYAAIMKTYYDLTVVYVTTLQRILNLGIDPTNGLDVVKEMKNESFYGVDNEEIYIDINRDRSCDVSVWDFNPGSTEFQISHRYSEKYESFHKVKSVHWPYGYGPPLDFPYCGYMDERCHKIGAGGVIGILILIASIIGGGVLGYYGVRKKIEMDKKLLESMWTLDTATVFMPEHSSLKSHDRSERTLKTFLDVTNLHDNINDNIVLTGAFQGFRVLIKVIDVRNLNHDYFDNSLKEVKTIRNIRQPNLVRFFAAGHVDDFAILITEFCSKGSLQTLLMDTTVEIDSNFKMSFVKDIIEGIYYIHKSSIQFHGRLNSLNCLITSRFMIRLSDFGLRFVRQNDQDLIKQRDLLWYAPEALRQYKLNGAPHSDIYSFGIVIQEIITRCGPFYLDANDSAAIQEVIDNVKKEQNPPCRPLVMKGDCPDVIYDMMRECLEENPSIRPSIQQLRNRLRACIQDWTFKAAIQLVNICSSVGCAAFIPKENSIFSNVLDSLLYKLEKYSSQLEVIAKERTIALKEERLRVEVILLKLLPRPVADILLKGKAVRPQRVEAVTIYYSYIVGMTTIEEQSTPSEIVTFLNDLYDLFDGEIEKYDVTKIETFGDSYMVASGVPRRNGIKHAKEIGRLALNLLEKIKTFKIRHRPHNQLNLRIGIHTGSCVAGVVGVKMPRYCVFGSTIYIATQMESLGEAMKIQISHHTKSALDVKGGFEFIERGLIEIRNYGLLKTYWLIGELKK